MLQFPSNIGQNKKLIREFCRDIRQKLYLSGELDRISSLIVKNILKSEVFKTSKHIMLFYPIKDEINLLELLQYNDKTFYFPKCDGKNLFVCPNSAEYKKNKYSIPEPISPSIKDLSILDIVFTPALCADENLYRIGYGGGYYDRFFNDKNIKAKKIIPISEKLICTKLPHQDCDIQCDDIVCECGFKYLSWFI